MARLTCRVAVALLGALLLGPPRGAGASEIAVPQGSGISIILKLGNPSLSMGSCYITVSKRHITVLLIKAGERMSFVFSCRDPQNHFVMEIQKNIDCMSGPCPFGEVQLQPSAAQLQLPALNRTFLWDIQANKSGGLELRFSLPRLRQIGPGESCADGVTRSIIGHVDRATVSIGTFCGNGTVSRIEVQGRVKMALHLPWAHRTNSSGFSITNRSSIKRLCIVESVFEGEGSATLLSANFPSGFPEDELMTWQFLVPPHLRASVSFLNFTVSNCEKKEERVEYYIPGSTTNPEVFRLQDQQPGNMAGTFNLSLQGCDQDALNPGALRLKFQVLVQRPLNESSETYVVDLSQERALWLTIEQRPSRQGRKFVPGCFVCLESRTCGPNVTLAPGSKYKLSFLCDDLTRLWLHAEKTLSCMDPRYCPRRPYQLQVPADVLGLPVLLHSFSWRLLVPRERLGLALLPAQKLQQHTHERPCNTSLGYLVAGGTPQQALYLGPFCPGGSIQLVQVKQNITVTLRTFEPSAQREAALQSLAVSFIPHFKEEGIFTVTPDTKSKVYLRTPNWDQGMPALSSVSWNISVPSNQVASLTFFKERTGVVCQTGRAFMIIQDQQTRAEEIFSLEEDPLPKPSFHHHNFWVNISNCSPVSSKQLHLLFWVTLTPRTAGLAAVVAPVVGGGALLLLVLGIVVFCLVKKRKKSSQGPAVGVYNGNVNTHMPLQPPRFQKARKDNDSHVYDVIDDAMVYGHLLQSAGAFIPAEVDTYRPFPGPPGDGPPSPPMSSRVPTAKLTAGERPPDVAPEPESEPYTFSHPSKRRISIRDTDVPLLDTQGLTKPAETSLRRTDQGPNTPYGVPDQKS